LFVSPISAFGMLVKIITKISGFLLMLSPIRAFGNQKEASRD
jgi:hypothetical protein